MLTNLFFSPSAPFATTRSMASGTWMCCFRIFQAFEEELGGEPEVILFPQPHGVWASWLGLCVGACSGYKMGSDRFHSPLLLEDLSMLNS